MHNLEKTAVPIKGRDFKLEMKLDEKKENVIADLKGCFDRTSEIRAAKIYGSWLYNEKSRDVDIAAIIPSDRGVVDPEVYKTLKVLRQEATDRTGQDIDLTPHTEDEISDFRSPFYYPKHNSSLAYGLDIKGNLPIDLAYNLDNKFGFDDLTAALLYEARTVCRRQLVRSLEKEEGKVFVSKLIHGPGNALTFYSYQNKLPYISDPSHWPDSLRQLDVVYGVNSDSIAEFLKTCKQGVDHNMALRLMNWYEYLMAMILNGQEDVARYEDFCKSFSGKMVNA